MVRIKVGIVCCLLGMLLFFMGSSLREREVQETAGTSTASIDPSKIFPRWEQSWDCGNWTAIVNEPPYKEVVTMTTRRGKVLYQSFCGWCKSRRIVDPDTKRQRILLSPKARNEACEHRWLPGISQKTLEPLEAGDALVVVYREQMYFLRIQELIRPIDSPEGCASALCEFTKIGLGSGLDTEIDFRRLSWKKGTAIEVLPIPEHPVVFYVDSAENGDESPVMLFEYDAYYGHSYGPDARAYEDSAHIAVIHKADLQKNSVVDLAAYPFKTWEDGLSNKCGDETPSEGPSPIEQKTVYLDLHRTAIRDIAVPNDGAYVASVSCDPQVVIQYIDRPLRKVFGPFPHRSTFSSLLVSQDGTWLLAGADPHPYFPLSVKINTSDGSYETIDIPLAGTMISLFGYDSDKKVAYITAPNKLFFLDLELRQVTSSQEALGEFITSAAASPQVKFIATASVRNDANAASTEPCGLTIFDQQGNKTLTHQFENCRASALAKMAFLTEDCLALCLPIGEMWKWKWSPEKNQWSIEKKLRIESGRFSAVERSPDGKTLWLSIDKRLMAIDTGTGRTVHEQDFDIREPKSKFWVQPITVIKIVPGKGLLAVGFQDGRVALVPIPKTLVQESD